MTTKPNQQTKDAERREAAKAAGADRPPSPEEEEAAEQTAELDPSVAEHEQDMLARGAHQQGEGRI